MEYENYLQVAANMLSDDEEPWPGLLNTDLVRLLRAQASLIEKCGGELRSRQEIAGQIIIWQRMNPDTPSYGEIL